MVRASAGEKKKKLILQTCKTLFYEKGFSETTYADIAEAADIPQGSIAYHFDGKLAIGLAIRSEFEREDYRYTHTLLDAYGVGYRVRTVVGLLHYWKLLFDMGRIRRFLAEITAGGFADAERIAETRRYYRPVMAECGVEDIDERRLGLVAAAHVGMELELLACMEKEPDRYAYEELALFFIEQRFKLIGAPPSVYEPAIAEGRELFPSVPYDNRFYEYFAYDRSYLPAKV